MAAWSDFKSRVIDLILNTNSKALEGLNAFALAILGSYFGYWKTFHLPVAWAFVCILVGGIQITALIYNHRIARTLVSAFCIGLWGMLTSYVWQSAHEALSIPLMSTFGIGGSFLTLLFQGLSRGGSKSG